MAITVEPIVHVVEVQAKPRSSVTVSSPGRAAVTVSSARQSVEAASSSHTALATTTVKQSVVLSSFGRQGPPGKDAEFTLTELENVSPGTIPPGVPLRKSGTGVVPADALHPAFGVAASEALPGTACRVLLCGFLRIVGWGLSPGNSYFLGDGALATAPRSGEGEYVQKVGTAMNDEVLAVSIEQPVRL